MRGRKGKGGKKAFMNRRWSRKWSNTKAIMEMIKSNVIDSLFKGNSHLGIKISDSSHFRGSSDIATLWCPVIWKLFYVTAFCNMKKLRIKEYGTCSLVVRAIMNAYTSMRKARRTRKRGGEKLRKKSFTILEETRGWKGEKKKGQNVWRSKGIRFVQYECNFIL